MRRRIQQTSTHELLSTVFLKANNEEELREFACVNIVFFSTLEPLPALSGEKVSRKFPRNSQTRVNKINIDKNNIASQQESIKHQQRTNNKVFSTSKQHLTQLDRPTICSAPKNECESIALSPQQLDSNLR